MKRYAIFFPQFHQVKINDEAWGYGFTDWALVATANAFDYWNRRAPACGFYDLANENVIQERFKEAAEAGLDGFGIYHYYFDDGHELETVERYLSRAKLPDKFEYFFIWANESWSKRWAGRDTELLKISCTAPTRDDIRKHVSYLSLFMQGESYTKLAGRPIFVIYRPEFFKNPAETLNCYREEFRHIGLDPLIGFFLKNQTDVDYSKMFDFCYLFEPRLFFYFTNKKKQDFLNIFYKRMIHLIPYSKVEYLSKTISIFFKKKSKHYSFSSFLTYFNSEERKKIVSMLHCPVQNIITSGWNNAPRYRDKHIKFQTPDKEQFSSMLATALNDSAYTDSLPLLCNAWNEWSEGAAIEPCNYLGNSLLESYLDGKRQEK